MGIKHGNKHGINLTQQSGHQSGSARKRFAAFTTAAISTLCLSSVLFSFTVALASTNPANANPPLPSHQMLPTSVTSTMVLTYDELSQMLQEQMRTVETQPVSLTTQDMNVEPANANKSDKSDDVMFGTEESNTSATQHHAGTSGDEAHNFMGVETPQDNYYIEVGDKLNIVFPQHTELTRNDFLVNESGVISFPMVGEIALLNKTPVQLEKELMVAFKTYLKNPAVTVYLSDTKRPASYVLGAVKEPGYQSRLNKDDPSTTGRGGFRLNNALQLAGGINPNADIEHIVMFNQMTRQAKTINLLRYLTMGDISQNTILASNDVVYVPRLPDNQLNPPEIIKLIASANFGEDAFPVRVYGLVEHPDVYNLPVAEMTLHSVLAKAGMKMTATPKHITIARNYGDDRLVKVNVDASKQDFDLLPNDIVIVDQYRKRDVLSKVIMGLRDLYWASGQGRFYFLRNPGFMDFDVDSP